MKIQSEWAVDTNLIARRQLYETFVDKNSANENYFFPYFQRIIWITVSAAFTATFSKMTAGIFPHCEKTNLLFKRSLKSFAILTATRDGLVWSPPINLQKMLLSEPSNAGLDCLLCLQLQRASSEFLWSVL